MLSFSTTLVFLLSITCRALSQSLFQGPASTPTNLTIDLSLEQFVPVFGGLPLNDTSSTLPQCFTNHPGFPLFRPVGRPDCFLLFYTILVRPSAATPLRWDAAAATLPVTYKYGSCAISVYPAGPNSREVFTELGIARVAALVVEDCVTAPKLFLGGKRSIGSSNGYWVAVNG